MKEQDFTITKKKRSEMGHEQLLSNSSPPETLLIPDNIFPMIKVLNKIMWE